MKLKSLGATTLWMAIIFSSCGKDEQKNFPGETSVGANTFGCYINNQQFLPCKTLGGLSPVTKLQTSSVYYDANHIGINISSTNDCDKNYTYGRFIIIELDSIPITSDTTYQLRTYGDTARNKVACLYSQDLVPYTSDSSLNGSLTITHFDLFKRIISGRIEGTLKNTERNETVKLTAGVFDVTF